jgi:hypothetical protein
MEKVSAMNGSLQALLTAREFCSTLAGDGASGALRHCMFDFDALNELIETPQMMEEGKRYVGDAPAPRKVDVAL